MTYNLSLPFTETYAWEQFIEVCKKLKQSQKVVFYGFGKKIKVVKLYHERCLISNLNLSEPEELDLNKQRRFERVFMNAIMKDKHQGHVHVYERSENINPNWIKQVYRCIDPDCSHYTQAQFIIGKRALCAVCKEPMVIEKAQLRNKKVVGLCCSKSKRAKAFQTAAKVTEELEIFQNFKLEEINEPDLSTQTEGVGESKRTT